MPKMHPLLLALLLASSLGVACAGDRNAPVAATSSPPVSTDGTPQFEEMPTTEPPTPANPVPHLGVPAVDDAIGAVTRGDVSALRGLAILQDTTCRVDAGGIGPPYQCPAGVADGTALTILPTIACHQGYVLEDGQDEFWQELFRNPYVPGAATTPLLLDSVVRAGSPAPEGATYGIAFRYPDRAQVNGTLVSFGIVVWTTDAGIVAVSTGCGPTPAGTLLGEPAEYLVAPAQP